MRPSGAVVELLVEAGAPVNATDWRGNTPLHLALSYQQLTRRDDWSELVDLLVLRGAHVDAANACGMTAVDFLPRDVVFNHTTLKCLAARAVRACWLPCRRLVPVTLAVFVDKHGRH